MEVTKDIIKYKFRHSTYYAEISPNKKYLAVVGKSIYIYNYETGKKEKVYQILKYPSEIAFSNDSSLLAIKNTSGHIAVINILTDEVVCKNKMHNVEGCELYFSPDDKYIITGDWKGNIMMLNIKDNSCLGLNKLKRKDGTSKVDNIQKIEDDIYIFQSSFFNDYTKWIWKYPFKEKVLIKHDEGYNMECFCQANGLCARYSHMTNCYTIIDQYNNIVSLLLPLSKEEKFNGGWMFLKYSSWSVDGEYFATVIKRYDPEENVVNSIRFYETKTWTIVKEYDMKYACFVRFTPDGENVILGSWLAGYCIDIKELER